MWILRNSGKNAKGANGGKKKKTFEGTVKIYESWITVECL